jgi:ABC-type multidrug transport system ATPase subunit
MYNYDITQPKDMDSIRQIMGVCPQFDILWNELTAAEHLYIFARLKGNKIFNKTRHLDAYCYLFYDCQCLIYSIGLPAYQVPAEIDKRLSEVNLTSVKYAQAGTFSGGMKRRLSMAVAFIGDPKVVFLDEPTTGMDPKNRRHVWELIQKMKKGRVVILTTHAMEEADALSDRIAVVSHGSLKCIGTGLYLKNKYGDGYRLSIVVEKDDVEFMRNEIVRLIPSGKILDWSGGSILVGVPLISVEELKTFFK